MGVGGGEMTETSAFVTNLLFFQLLGVSRNLFQKIQAWAKLGQTLAPFPEKLHLSAYLI